MRLTLRTLLAYMDGILEPEDAEEIRKKIEASPVADDLLRRARDVMRRLRLKAPEVDDRGAGLDPNTVAEYLDHMLPDDRVPDFERVCLESDMHLAEVAACHQILALVLGEPAEVDPASRAHMYQLPQVLAEQATMQAVEGESVEEPVERSLPAITARRPRPVVPDYLREPPRRGRRLLRVVVAGVLLVCLGVIALGLGGQLDRWGINLETLLAGRSDEPSPAIPPDTSNAPVQPALPAAPGTENPVAPPPVAPSEPAALPGPSGPGEGPTVLPAPPSPLPPLSDGPSPLPAIPPTVEPGPAGPNVEPGVVPPGAKEPEETGGETGGSEGPLAPAAKEAEENTPGSPVTPSGPAPERPVEPGEAPPEEAPRIGLFVSDDDILLRSGPESAPWNRIPAQGILTSKNVLLALPTYRPLVALSNSTTVQLVDGSQIQLQATDEDGVLGVELDFGRVIFRTVGKAGARLSLDLAGRRGVVTLEDPDSTLAVEVSRPFVFGANPETEPTEPVVEFWVKSGRVLWKEAEGDTSQSLAAPARWTPGTPTPVQPINPAELPDWVATGGVSKLDQWASTTIAQAIQTDRPVALALQELTSHRKKEVVRLAERCLGYLGDFGPMAKSLNDRQRHLDWPDYVTQLRQALGRGPATARAVRESLERTYGPSGAKLARMLQGYTNEQLAAGADDELVGTLDHEILAFRVLAFLDLKEITGAGLYYQPHELPAKRQQPVRSWQQRQSAGEIRWPVAKGNEPGKKGPFPPKPDSPPAAPSTMPHTP